MPKRASLVEVYSIAPLDCNSPVGLETDCSRVFSELLARSAALVTCTDE